MVINGTVFMYNILTVFDYVFANNHTCIQSVYFCIFQYVTVPFSYVAIITFCTYFMQ